MKIVLNRCYGGFGLSPKAYKILGLSWDGFGCAFRDYAKRSDTKLVDVVERLGNDASFNYSKLVVVEIPDKSKYVISDYDGCESLYYSESEIKEI